jgi:N-acetylglucosaminyldiphosphoundecaprenol N-acetyl-beta-D-mannosaminyltransferase
MPTNRVCGKSCTIRKKTVVGHVNVKGMNLAYEMPWYRDFLNDSDLVFCDGFGVLVGAKLLVTLLHLDTG